MDRILTIAVPCYNSDGYLSKCLESLVHAGDDVEVIVVNDGSTDETSDIAASFARRYPNIVTVFEQENSGWGEAVNRALANAHGTYFYEVDADDHLDTKIFSQAVELLRGFVRDGEQVDLFMTNYVYDHVKDAKKHTIAYRGLMPSNRVYTWSDLGRNKVDQYLMIHAMCYRTQVLRESGLHLPAHMSYMDSFYVLHPLPYVKKLYYFDADLYYYLIGRDGQSIDIEVLKTKIDQQLVATRMVIDDFDYDKLCEISPQLAKCVSRYLSTMMVVSTVYLFKVDTPESIAMVDEIWSYLEARDPVMYRKVHRSWAGAVYRKSASGRMVARGGYTGAKHLFKFA